VFIAAGARGAVGQKIVGQNGGYQQKDQILERPLLAERSSTPRFIQRNMPRPYRQDLHRLQRLSRHQHIFRSLTKNYLLLRWKLQARNSYGAAA
jgi:hypothetical protein